MSDTSLFRPEALEAQRAQFHGDIVMVQPITYKFLALLAAGLAGALIAFAIFVSYTKRTTVIGQVAPDLGLAKQYVHQPGIVVEERVKEGQRISKGDVLFVLSSERRSSTVGATQAVISEQARLRQKSLYQDLEKTQQLAKIEISALRMKIAALQDELPRLTIQLESQRARVELSEEAQRRYLGLNQQGFISQDQLILKQAELLDQRARLEGLERDKIITVRNLNDALGQLDALPLKYENQVSELRRGVSSLEQELSESEARREYLVIATETGTATAITAHRGQLVDTSKPIVSIVPDGSTFQAHLYAPSRAIGFVRPGDTVRIRYHAFPYQKFGQYDGTVADIAATALSSAELTGSSMFAGSQGVEPIYRISVQLGSQQVTAYGKPQLLQAGMLLDADILQEKRRLYEWILEPLYSLSGKL